MRDAFVNMFVYASAALQTVKKIDWLACLLSKWKMYILHEKSLKAVGFSSEFCLLWRALRAQNARLTQSCCKEHNMATQVHIFYFIALYKLSDCGALICELCLLAILAVHPVSISCFWRSSVPGWKLWANIHIAFFLGEYCKYWRRS